MSDGNRWSEIGPDPVTAELIPPIHPRFDSIRQRENFYLGQIPNGVSLPACYRVSSTEYSYIIPGFRSGDSILYYTYSIARRVVSPSTRPLFYCWQLDLSDLEQDGPSVQHLFPVYQAPVESEYVWAQSFGRLAVDLWNFRSAHNPISVRGSEGQSWTPFFVACPQCTTTRDYQRVPAREAPPDDFPWPPQYYDWWLTNGSNASG